MNRQYSGISPKFCNYEEAALFLQNLEGWRWYVIFRSNSMGSEFWEVKTRYASCLIPCMVKTLAYGTNQKKIIKEKNSNEIIIEHRIKDRVRKVNQAKTETDQTIAFVKLVRFLARIEGFNLEDTDLAEILESKEWEIQEYRDRAQNMVDA
jgi:hypothetical protein